MAIQEYKTAAQSNYGFPLTFDAAKKAPVIAKRIWSTYADALAWINDPNQNAVAGLQLSVINDLDAKKNGVYFVSKIGTGAKDEAGEYIGGELVKVGEGSGSMPVTRPTVGEDGKVAEATADNIGQIIYITSAPAESESDESKKYIVGPYIVTGEGVLSSIGISSVDNPDLSTTVAALGGRVSTLETDSSALKTTVGNEGSGLVKDVADLKTAVDGIEIPVKDVTFDGTSLIGEAGVVSLDTFATSASVSDALSKKASSDDLTSAVNTINGKLDEKATISALESAVNTINGELDKKANASDVNSALAEKANASDVDALSTKVGDAASEGVAATGLYKVIADTETALRSIISEIPKFEIKVVESLPETGDKATVYLVKEKENIGDLYTEYIYVNDVWENLGKQTIDFSAYSTTEQMNAAIAKAVNEAEYVKTSDFDTYKNGMTTTLADYAKKADVNTSLDLKADKSTLEAYVASNDAAVALKADKSTLEAYVTSNDKAVADLTTYVDTELAKKVAIEEGKRLMTNAEGEKLAGIAVGAEVNYVKSVGDNLAVDDAGKLTVDLSAYATSGAVNTLLTEYTKTSNLASVLGLADYAKKADVDNTLKSYVTKDSLTETLESYVTGTALNNTLGSYVLASDYTAKVSELNTNIGTKLDKTAAMSTTDIDNAIAGTVVEE